jgi:hypothetical protein
LGSWRCNLRNRIVDWHGGQQGHRRRAAQVRPPAPARCCRAGAVLPRTQWQSVGQQGPGRRGVGARKRLTLT